MGLDLYTFGWLHGGGIWYLWAQALSTFLSTGTVLALSEGAPGQEVGRGGENLGVGSSGKIQPLWLWPTPPCECGVCVVRWLKLGEGTSRKLGLLGLASGSVEVLPVCYLW